MRSNSLRAAESQACSSITGREGQILVKALAYAIEAIERLPPQWQEASDRRDMLALLTALVGGEWADHWRTIARGHLERRGATAVAGQLVLAERDDPEIIRGVW
jgi:hypothetical protein